MRQPRINKSQIQYILSHKVLFEEFTPNKSYDKSIIIRVNDELYLSKDDIEGKEEFDPTDWIQFSNASDIEDLIADERDRAETVEASLRDDLDAEILRALTAENALDIAKLDKILLSNQVYVTDNNAVQTSLVYSTDNIASTIVQRDINSQINVNLEPTSNSHVTSKKYVDDRINAAISEAVVFKGIVNDETELPSSGNTNGDMYWIRAFSDNPPQGMTPGRSGAAIYNGTLEEFQFTEDAIYQPDNNTIELNTNGQLKVKISAVANNSLEVRNDGLFIDISEKVDKIHTANKVYVTDSNNAQSSISYDTNNTASTIVQRDSNSQINVNVTPTIDSHASSKKYVDDAISTLNTNKQDRPSTAIQNNIAVFNNTKDTIDSGKAFTTSIDINASNDKIPTEYAIRTELDTKVDKTDSLNQVYVTDGLGEQSSISYDIENTASTIVQRSSGGQINVNLTPSSNTNATSKKYVDDADSSLNTNKQDRPLTAIQNNIAVFNATKDTIDSGKAFTTSISSISEASDNKIATEKAIRTELDTKVDKTSTINQAYITDNNGNQTTITYDISNTANTFVERDNNGQINVNLTPSSNANATSKKYVDDQDYLKVDKVSGSKRVYGTDSDGNQTTYDYDSFGKVDDVKVGNTSVVTNKIANLGTMAGESKDDYVLANTAIIGNTKTKITYDSKGLVTAGADLVENDIPSLHLTKVSDVTTTATELNQLHNGTAVQSDFIKLHNISADANEINVLDGITASTSELNILDGVTADANEINVLDGITASTSELNVLDGITASTAELNILDGVTADANEINVLDGITATTAELNYISGVTSNIQSQIDNKVDKTTYVKKIYATDTNGAQTTLSYSQSQNASYLVQRDSDAQVPVPEIPIADENAASKKYVDMGLALKPDSTSISAVGYSGEYSDLLNSPTFKTINSENIVGTGNIPLQTQLSGTNGNVVTYTSTTGTLSELGFDNAPSQNSNKLVKSGAIWTALSSKINYSDVVNDLTTGGTTVPLSAEQGKELDYKITLAQQSTHDRGVVLNALTSQGTNYTITAATINSAGTNYIVGDTLFLTSDLFIDAIITVSSVNTTTGAITGITLGDGGAFTTQPASTGVAFVGGAGSGAKFNLTSTQVNNSTLNSIANPSANDFATVLSDEIHNDLRYVWKYADIDGDGTYEWVAGYPITNIERNFTVDPIKNNELDSNAVTTAKIANNNVTDVKIADDAIKTRHIDDGTIVNAHIASGAAIDQSKINNLTTDLGNKVSKTSTAYQLYGTSAANTETTVTYDTSNTASTIAQRDSNSQINVNLTPTANTHATSKKYVDDGLSGKVDKVNGNKRVYGTDGSGNQTTYDYDSFGKVDDVKVGTTSVLVNKIATLGTMAGESKDDYVHVNTAITGATKCKITYDSKGLVTAGADLQASDIPSLTLSKISDVTASASELNILDGVTASTSELNILNGVTASTSELNVLDGITASTTELNYVDGVTSAIQTQLNGKQATLVSGTNIKTINSTSLLGGGNIVIDGLPSQTGSSGKYLTTNGTTASWATVDALPSQTSQSGKYLTTNGTSASWADIPTEIPSQSGNAGKYLTTNGTSVSWAIVDALPSQTGQSGKYLTTNGTSASWATIDLSGYQPIITGAATTITSSDLTASRALISNSSGKVAVSSVTSTELGYVSGVTSAIQTQLNNKVAANTAISGATKCKITYDSKGLVTSGADLSASDIPSLTLSKISDITATATELNVLDGITASTTELNYVDGVTSSIQTQLNGKQATLVSGTNIKTINNNSLLGNGNITIDSLPSQTGNFGKFLTTNGTSASWGDPLVGIEAFTAAEVQTIWDSVVPN